MLHKSIAWEKRYTLLVFKSVPANMSSVFYHSYSRNICVLSGKKSNEIGAANE